MSIHWGGKGPGHVNRLPRGLSVFSPASLFAAGEPGAWYDPSDFSTLFQDSAGTTPVTAVAQQVGLMLDKSQGLVLGPELVTNSWTRGFLSVDGTILVSGPSVTITQGAGDGSGFRWVQPITCVVGRSYRLSLSNATKVGGTLALAAISSNSSGTGITADNSINDGQVPGQKFVVATATTMYVVISLSGGSTGNSATFTGLSVKELPGNHAFQSNSGQRPTLGRNPTTGRLNLLTFTEQFDNAVWSKSGATVTANAAIAPDGTMTADQVVFASGTSEIFQAAGSGGTNVGSVWVKGTAGETIQIYDAYTPRTPTVLTGDWQRLSVPVLGAIRYLDISAANGSTARTIFLWGAQLQTGTIATAYQRVVSSFDVTEAGKPDLYYVNFDGTDDGMLTNTITPGIDKAQVFTGVRKFSDTPGGVILESSADTNANAGSLAMFPQTGTGVGVYRFRTRGSAAPVNADSATAYNAPITNILTGIGDIAADTAILRVNAAQVGTSAADQGTGNYLAYPLYLGRRGGTTLPFSGNIYSMIVRFGANLTADQIAATEAWVNTKTAALPVDYYYLQTATGDQLVDGNGDELYSLPIFG